eukprot:6318056-Amphidinium_carterae.1
MQWTDIPLPSCRSYTAPAASPDCSLGEASGSRWASLPWAGVRWTKPLTSASKLRNTPERARQWPEFSSTAP